MKIGFSQIAATAVAAVLLSWAVPSRAEPQPPAPGCHRIDIRNYLDRPWHTIRTRDSETGDVIYWYCPEPSKDQPGSHFYMGGLVGAGWSDTRFENVTPPFAVNGSGFVGTVYGGYQLVIPGSGIGIGPQIGWMGGNINGSITNPMASPGNRYDTHVDSVFFGEGRISIPIGSRLSNAPLSKLTAGAAWWNYLYATAGVASVNGSIDCSCGAGDRRARVGPTASIGLSVPVTPNLSVVGQVRGVWLPSTTFNLPGAVSINQPIYTASVGLEWDLWNVNPPR
jgi:hypothetical protein